jgi:hypothetical protein
MLPLRWWLSEVRTCARVQSHLGNGWTPRHVAGASCPLHRLREQVVTAVWMKRGVGCPHGIQCLTSLMIRAEEVPAESDWWSDGEASTPAATRRRGDAAQRKHGDAVTEARG